MFGALRFEDFHVSKARHGTPAGRAAAKDKKERNEAGEPGFSVRHGIGEETGRAARIGLELVAVEEAVLFAVGAVRTLQTANKEYGHAYRDQNGEDGSVYREPMIQSKHVH